MDLFTLQGDRDLSLGRAQVRRARVDLREQPVPAALVARDRELARSIDERARRLERGARRALIELRLREEVVGEQREIDGRPAGERAPRTAGSWE